MTKTTGIDKIPYYRQRLTEYLAGRQRINRSYSLRAFANHLQIQAPSLAAILKGKRALPIRYCDSFCEKMSMSPLEKAKFVRSVKSHRTSLDTEISEPSESQLLEEDNHFHVIAEWEHYAILSLIDTTGFKSSAEHVAERLGLTNARAETCLRRLIAAELIFTDKSGKFQKRKPNVKTSEDLSSAALKKSHIESLQMGVEKISTLSVDQRDFSSSTLAFSPAELERAKKLIRGFRRKFVESMDDPVGSEVYQICIQVYPLTISQEKS